jgi:hypothetical protein
MHKYHSDRLHNLSLYPNVIPTFEELKNISTIAFIIALITGSILYIENTIKKKSNLELTITSDFNSIATEKIPIFLLRTSILCSSYNRSSASSKIAEN